MYCHHSNRVCMLTLQIVPYSVRRYHFSLIQVWQSGHTCDSEERAFVKLLDPGAENSMTPFSKVGLMHDAETSREKAWQLTYFHEFLNSHRTTQKIANRFAPRVAKRVYLGGGADRFSKFWGDGALFNKYCLSTICKSVLNASRNGQKKTRCIEKSQRLCYS